MSSNSRAKEIQKHHPLSASEELNKSADKDSTNPLSGSSSSSSRHRNYLTRRRRSLSTSALPISSSEIKRFEDIVLADYTPPLIEIDNEDGELVDDVLNALPLLSQKKVIDPGIADNNKIKFDRRRKLEERTKYLFQRRKERYASRTAFVEKLLKEQKESQAVYQGATPPKNEAERLAALQKMNILDSSFDENFDRITKLAVTLFGLKIAVISLVDEHRQWFKSIQGLDVQYTCRNVAFCAYAIKQTEPLIVLDATKDDRFKNNPLVVNSPFIRFYAGAPLVSSDGFHLGTLCLIDMAPRDKFDETQQNILKNLASIAVREMELFRQNQVIVKEGQRHQIVAELCQQTLQTDSMKDLYDINMIRMAEVLDVDFIHILEFTEDEKNSIMRAGFGWGSSVKVGQHIDVSAISSSLLKLKEMAAKEKSEATINNTSQQNQTQTKKEGEGTTKGVDFNGAVMVIEDMDTMRLSSGSHVHLASIPSVLSHHFVKSGMCVLLSYNEKPFGIVGAYDTHAHAWHSEDAIFLMNCAKSLSVLIERTQHSIEVATERKRADNLLYHVLPVPISDRLKGHEFPIADAYASTTVLFADMVNFTVLSTQVRPQELVSFLNRVFSAFDTIAISSGLEKIKTIGDCYMAAGGLFSHEKDHADATVKFAFKILSELEKIKKTEPPIFSHVKIRIGIHSGPIVAGVIGLHKFLYDIWGDTVNTASRLESAGAPCRVHISDDTRKLIENTNKQWSEEYSIDHRGDVFLKGKGNMLTYFISPVSETTQKEEGEAKKEEQTQAITTTDSKTTTITNTTIYSPDGSPVNVIVDEISTKIHLESTPSCDKDVTSKKETHKQTIKEPITTTPTSSICTSIGSGAN